MNLAIRVICGAYLTFSFMVWFVALCHILNIDIWPFGRKGRKQ